MPQLLVQHRPQFAPFGVHGFACRGLANVQLREHLDTVALATGLAGAGRHLIGDGVQPGADGFRRADRRGTAGQHEERRLEGVLGVVTVGQDAPAHTMDHRSMPLHQHLERRRVVLCDEALQ